jgi:hypothetical protein
LDDIRCFLGISKRVDEGFITKNITLCSFEQMEDLIFNFFELLLVFCILDNKLLPGDASV